MCASRWFSVLFAALGLCILVSCSSEGKYNHALRRIDSLLQAGSDSAAMALLDTIGNEKLPSGDKAYYALLRAMAADKGGLPLFPCDSLIEEACGYFSKKDLRKAKSLFYKGKILDELKEPLRAVKALRNALDALQECPEGGEDVRSKIYNELGNIYLKQHAAGMAKQMFFIARSHSPLPSDRVVSLENIGSACLLSGQEDSACFFYRKALHYASLSRDSLLLSNALYNLGMGFRHFGKKDSAIVYVRSSIRCVPSGAGREKYCEALGELLSVGVSKADSALYYLNFGKRSNDIQLRALSILALAHAETAQGNHKRANSYLEQYISIEDSLDAVYKASSIEKQAYRHEAWVEKVEERRMVRRLVGGSLFLVLVIIIFYQRMLRRKNTARLKYEQSLNEMEIKFEWMRKSVMESYSVIRSLQKAQSANKDEIKRRKQEIESKELEIERLFAEQQQIRTWQLKQTPVYNKVIELCGQKNSGRKELKVLSHKEQEQLRRIVFEIYGGYIRYQQQKYPKLTKEDLLFLCLQTAGLDSFAIAVCFGNINKQVVKQRKYRIKLKMGEGKDTKN